MTWEEAVIYARQKVELKELIRAAYLSEDLIDNVERFRNSSEFKDTLKWIKKYSPNAKSILDIGAGNGISSVAFSLNGYDVIAIEPDKSNTVGAGAIKFLKKHYKLQNIEIVNEYAENIKLKNYVDIVYARQAMHHALNLQEFIINTTRFLKKGGVFMTVRDHIIFDEKDKQWFLNSHPLQKYYHGENAYREDEYTTAIKSAGLRIFKILRYYDSVINYSPQTVSEIEAKMKIQKQMLKNWIKNKLPVIGDLRIIQKLYIKYYKFKKKSLLNEKEIPGRIYSFIAKK